MQLAKHSSIDGTNEPSLDTFSTSIHKDSDANFDKKFISALSLAAILFFLNILQSDFLSSLISSTLYALENLLIIYICSISIRRTASADDDQSWSIIPLAYSAFLIGMILNIFGVSFLGLGHGTIIWPVVAVEYSCYFLGLTLLPSIGTDKTRLKQIKGILELIMLFLSGGAVSWQVTLIALGKHGYSTILLTGLLSSAAVIGFYALPIILSIRVLRTARRTGTKLITPTAFISIMVLIIAAGIEISQVISSSHSSNMATYIASSTVIILLWCMRCLTAKIQLEAKASINDTSIVIENAEKRIPKQRTLTATAGSAMLLLIFSLINSNNTQQITITISICLISMLVIYRTLEVNNIHAANDKQKTNIEELNVSNRVLQQQRAELALWHQELGAELSAMARTIELVLAGNSSERCDVRSAELFGLASLVNTLLESTKVSGSGGITIDPNETLESLINASKKQETQSNKQTKEIIGKIQDELSNLASVTLRSSSDMRLSDNFSRKLKDLREILETDNETVRHTLEDIELLNSDFSQRVRSRAETLRTISKGLGNSLEELRKFAGQSPGAQKPN